MTEHLRDTTKQEPKEETTEQRLAREAQAENLNRRTEGWEVIMATPEGRAVIWDIIAFRLYAIQPTYNINDAPEQTVGRAAVQSAGAQLMSYVAGKWPHYASLMYKENMI